ncbi:MAG: hypothetical protein JO035_10605 [Betaproteobacteria bacterium]|nr:hypothetical protein [Betaproteobacteria bacterium]
MNPTRRLLLQAATLAAAPWAWPAAAEQQRGVGFRVGDSYSYRVRDPISMAVTGQFTSAVTEVSAEEVMFSTGLVTDLRGNTRRNPAGKDLTPRQEFPPEYEVGRRWFTSYQYLQRDGQTWRMDLEGVVAAFEEVSCPAGTFDAYRIELKGWETGLRPLRSYVYTTWMAPGRVRAPLIRESINRVASVIVPNSYRIELVAFEQAA